MIAVIFEVWPKAAHAKDYFDLAAQLRPELETIEGFISIERFESLSEPGKFLSLSFFKDEIAIKEWRNLKAHRRAQARGRAQIFENYRIRIGGIIRDYEMHNRAQAPLDAQHAARIGADD